MVTAGAASSVGSGASAEDLDFASVQRGNPEIQRRAQEVIDQCWALGEGNPILLIHDVGAGGLSNAIPESIAHSNRGGRIELRAVPSVDKERVDPRSYLERFLFDSHAQRKKVAALSGGERARLAIARLLASAANLLLLDEPSNDLDTDTLSALEDFLSTYEGSVLVVTGLQSQSLPPGPCRP